MNKSKTNRTLSQGPGSWPKEKYSKKLAWLYILRLAMHREKYPYRPRKKYKYYAKEKYKWYVKDKDKARPFILERGQVGIKKSKLADRWGWSRSKVQRFFKKLAAEGRITQILYDGQCSIITILDLDKEFKNKPK